MLKPVELVPENADRDPLTPKGVLSCHIDMAALRKLPMGDLNKFREITNTVQNVLSAFLCQPRFQEHDEDDQLIGLTAGGELLERVAEFLAGYEQAAINVAEAAKPEDQEEVRHRAWALIGFAADISDDLGEMSLLAAQAFIDERNATFNKKR